MHQGPNHFLTNISSKSNIKHLICQLQKHQSQINIMVSPKNAHTAYAIGWQGPPLKMGQFGYTH
jgi:hypothetical protein